MLTIKPRFHVMHQTKTNLASSPTTFNFSIPYSRINLLNVKVNASLSDTAFRNYGIYAVKKGGGDSRVISGGKILPLTITTPTGTGGGGASGGSGTSGGAGGAASLLSILENEDLQVIVDHAGASGSEETITVTIEFEVLE